MGARGIPDLEHSTGSLHQEVFTAEGHSVSRFPADRVAASGLEVHKLYGSVYVGAGNGAGDDRSGRRIGVKVRNLIAPREVLDIGRCVNYSLDHAGRGVSNYHNAIPADGDGASPITGERECLDIFVGTWTRLPMTQ
jgi:hypothetical protein